MSIVGEASWAAAGIGWIAYGILFHTPVLILSGALATIGSSGICFLLRKAPSARTWTLSALAASSLIIALIIGFLTWGANGVSTVLAVFGVVQFLPQAVNTIRRWNLRNPGVSQSAATLRGLYTLSWAGYAAGWAIFSIGRADWPLIAWGVTGAIVFFAQALSVWRHARKNPIATG